MLLLQYTLLRFRSFYVLKIRFINILSNNVKHILNAVVLCNT